MSSEMYGVELVDRAFEFVLGLGDALYDRTMQTLGLLASSPWLGRAYSPEYEAMSPPVECRRIVVPRTTVELFYYVDEVHRTVKVIHACDARSDPRGKFVGLHASDL